MDRNDNGNPVEISDLESLSARRAWIEICPGRIWSTAFASLSARRAWIEMPISRGFSGGWRGRSPQGERG